MGRAIVTLLTTVLFAFSPLEAKPRVVASNSILWDMARTVGGPDIECVSLVPIGVDPHNFQPSPDDIRTLGSAEVVIANGLGYEPWLDRLIKSSGFKGSVTLASTGVEAIEVEHGEDSHGHDHDGHDHVFDAHAWHDLRNAILYVANICRGLQAADPTNATAYETRARALNERLETLHEEMTRALSEIPPEHRKIVTSHDSLAYLGKAYGLKVVAIRGLTPDREPSARAMARLVDRVRKEKIRAVFIESTSNPKMPRLLAEEAGVAVVTELYTDSLGSPGSPGSTFLGMARANLRTLLRSLETP